MLTRAQLILQVDTLVPSGQDRVLAPEGLEDFDEMFDGLRYSCAIVGWAKSAPKGQKGLKKA